jgi:hypothetical protein
MPHVKTRMFLPVALPCLMLAATVLAGCSDDTPVNTAAPATTGAAASAASSGQPGAAASSAAPST